jgi:hypothetical protein
MIPCACIALLSTACEGNSCSTEVVIKILHTRTKSCDDLCAPRCAAGLRAPDCPRLVFLFFHCRRETTRGYTRVGDGTRYQSALSTQIRDELSQHPVRCAFVRRVAVMSSLKSPQPRVNSFKLSSFILPLKNSKHKIFFSPRIPIPTHPMLFCARHISNVLCETNRSNHREMCKCEEKCPTPKPLCTPPLRCLTPHALRTGPPTGASVRTRPRLRAGFGRARARKGADIVARRRGFVCRVLFGDFWGRMRWDGRLRGLVAFGRLGVWRLEAEASEVERPVGGLSLLRVCSVTRHSFLVVFF